MADEDMSDDSIKVSITDALRKRGLGLQMEVQSSEGWWFIIDKGLARQAVKRYRNPFVLLELVWSESEDIWPLLVVE